MGVDHKIDYRNARRAPGVEHRGETKVKRQDKPTAKLIDDDLKPMNEKLIRNYIVRQVMINNEASATKIKEQLDEDGYRSPSLVLIGGVRSHVVHAVRWLKENKMLSNKGIERYRLAQKEEDQEDEEDTDETQTPHNKKSKKVRDDDETEDA
jgi:hypothetical protein